MNTKKVFFKSKVFFFRRWQNKSYSVFNSIGKIIIILVLPTVYLTVFNNSSFSQDTLNLQKIIVQSTKKPILFNETFRLVKIITKSELSSTAADNLADILKSSLGVDIRQRGIDEVQADVSINGGTFDQVLILLNGVPMSDAQTGHNSLTLPVDLDNIESIEILQGPGTRLYGLNAYSGAINIITKPSSKKSFLINLSAGNFAYQKASVNLNFLCGKSMNLFAFSTSKSDGYSENTDFLINKIYYNSVLKLSKANISFQTGLTTKKYGAFSFYTPTFPFQYEALNNQMASLRIDFGSKIKSNINLWYHRNQDKFELFRQGENWYQHSGDFWIRNANDTAKFVQNLYIPSVYYHGHNYHCTNVLGANYNLMFSSKIGETVLGIDIRHTSILSNVLGQNSDTIAVLFEKNAFYTKSASQDNFSFYADHSISINKFRFSAGASLNFNSMFGFYSAFGTELALKFSDKYSCFASINQGIRMPTFTDLYYKGPSNLGNENLVPEKSTSFELANRFINKFVIFQASAFYRLGQNTIDWVKISDEYLWQSMNYTQLNTYGISVSTKIYFDKVFNNRLIKSIDLNYSYLYQQKPEQDYISKYVLDYLQNSFNVKIVQEPIKNLTLSWNANYLQRKGTYTFADENGILQEQNYSPFWLVDFAVSYKIMFATLYVKCSNLFNTQYYDISNVKLPGRWFKTGIKFLF